MGEFDKLKQLLSSPEQDAKLDEAQETFNRLVDLHRSAIRSQSAEDFEGFLSAGMEVATITSDLDRDQVLMLLLGACSVIARFEEEQA